MSANPTSTSTQTSSVPVPKFLVTGATGFVGASLVEELIKLHGFGSVTALVHTLGRAREEARLKEWRGQGMQIIEADLLELPKRGLAVPAFDVIYHLAGFTESENRTGPFAVNSDGTRNLLEWLGSSLTGKRLVYAGTVASIDAVAPHAALDESVVCQPKTPYGVSKLEGEAYVKSFAARLNFTYTIPRLCTIVGQGYRPGGMFGVLPAMLGRGAWSARLNWPGRSSYLSKADLVRILLALPGRPETANQTYHLDNGEGPTFDQIIELTAQVLKLPRKRIVLPGWCWRMLHGVASAVVASKLAPHGLHTACWRATHIIAHGLWADGTKITRLLNMKYQSCAEALRDAYEK